MSFSLEPAGDAGQGAAVEVEGIDVAHELGLLLVDDEVAVLTPVVAEKPAERDGHFPVREPFPVSPGDVLRYGAGFLLRQAGHDRDEQLAFGVERPDVLLFEVHLHPGVLQLAHGGQGVYGVAGEPRHGLGDDQVDLARQCVGDHRLESGAVFGGGAGDAFVGVDSGELPAGVVGDVAGVVVDLRLIRGDLIFMAGGDSGVACDLANTRLVEGLAGVAAFGGRDRGDGARHLAFTPLSAEPFRFGFGDGPVFREGFGRCWCAAAVETVGAGVLPAGFDQLRPRGFLRRGPGGLLQVWPPRVTTGGAIGVVERVVVFPGHVDVVDARSEHVVVELVDTEDAGDEGGSSYLRVW